jgi:hypothetical protein
MDELDFLIEEVCLEENIVIDEGLRDLIRQKFTNPYAQRHGLHQSPGWVRDPQKRREITKSVIRHIAGRIVGNNIIKPRPINIKPAKKSQQKEYEQERQRTQRNRDRYEKEKEERENKPKNPMYSQSATSIRKLEEGKKTYREFIDSL